MSPHFPLESWGSGRLNERLRGENVCGTGHFLYYRRPSQNITITTTSSYQQVETPEACGSSRPLALSHLVLLPLSSTVLHHTLVQAALNPLLLETPSIIASDSLGNPVDGEDHPHPTPCRAWE